MTKKIINKLGLEQEKDKIIRYLSGGQKSWFVLDRPWQGDNEILILDEPTADIDVENRKILHTYLDELRRSGTTILFTTQFLDDIEDWATRLIIPIKGNIVYDCSPTQIVENLYHSKIEIPYPERTLEFVKSTGLIYTVSDREIYIH
ncbi:MAG: ATP-binding cassette domain-containing protein [Thermoplasmata archaeon]